MPEGNRLIDNLGSARMLRPKNMGIIRQMVLLMRALSRIGDMKKICDTFPVIRFDIYQRHGSEGRSCDPLQTETNVWSYDTKSIWKMHDCKITDKIHTMLFLANSHADQRETAVACNNITTVINQSETIQSHFPSIERLL